MKKQPASLSEKQQDPAVLQCLALLRLHLEKGISQAEIARMYNIPPSTIQSWVKLYRKNGLAGLANISRTSKEMLQNISLQAISRCPGKPAVINSPKERCFPQYIPSHPNALWKAYHIQLKVWLLDNKGKLARPWLTFIEDAYSCAIAGYQLNFQKANISHITLTLRQAIWRKEDARWYVRGIPDAFSLGYDRNEMTQDLEKVAADLHITLLFSQAGISQTTSTTQHFISQMDKQLLQKTPGYAPGRKKGIEAHLTLPIFTQRFQTWLLEDYHRCIHSETEYSPKDRWESRGFLPRRPDSLECLDLLLQIEPKPRCVQRYGIAFNGRRYHNPLLKDYVQEKMLLRYDPADMAEIRVFYQEQFLCCAICPELSGIMLSLEESTTACTRHSLQNHEEQDSIPLREDVSLPRL